MRAERMIAELNRQLGADGQFIVFTGVEVSDAFNTRPVHINGIGVRNTILPQGGNSVAQVIDLAAAAIQASGGLAILNHPNGLISAALTAAEIGSSSISVFEVCCSDYLGGSNHPSTEDIWDSVLSTGQKLYAIAADDAHDFSPEGKDPGASWINVRAEALTFDAIRTAIKTGDFYATTGARIEDIRFWRNELCLDIADYEEYGFRTFFIGKNGRVLAKDESRNPCFAPMSGEPYVRARIQRSDGKLAWTQPYWPSTG